MSQSKPTLNTPPKLAAAPPPPPRSQILQFGLKFPWVPVANTVPKQDRR